MRLSTSNRIQSQADGDDTDEVRLLVLSSPKGGTPKRVVMNPSRYVPQSDDIVADPWVSDETMR